MSLPRDAIESLSGAPRARTPSMGVAVPAACCAWRAAAVQGQTDGGWQARIAAAAATASQPHFQQSTGRGAHRRSPAPLWLMCVARPRARSGASPI